MNYISPKYDKISVNSCDVVCESYSETVYTDGDGNKVQEMDYPFLDILKI